MKIHRHLILEIFKAANDIFFEGGYADKTIEHYLKVNRKWGARDRKFFAENVYDMVRWWRKLWFIVGKNPNTDINDHWKILGVLWKLRQKEIPAEKEFEFLKSLKLPTDFSQAVEHSIPDWLDELGQNQLGRRWAAVLTKLNEPAEVVLRVNTLKVSRKVLRESLLKEGIEASELEEYPEGLLLKERKNVFVTEAFKSGLFEVQDANSQLVAPFLNPKAGMRVIDACAGAGGKALHLATLMGNKGKVVALDIHGHKLDDLQKRARRNHIDIIETRVIDSTKVIKRLEASADRVLLDVPCTGLGVLRRNPDTKWKLTPEKIQELEAIQSDILKRYSNMTKVGGELVYSTCSILPIENQQIVEKFLNGNSNWEQIEERCCFPEDTGYDGFFMTRLKRIR